MNAAGRSLISRSTGVVNPDRGVQFSHGARYPFAAVNLVVEGDDIEGGRHAVPGEGSTTSRVVHAVLRVEMGKRCQVGG